MHTSGRPPGTPSQDCDRAAALAHTQNTPKQPLPEQRARHLLRNREIRLPACCWRGRCKWRTHNLQTFSRRLHGRCCASAHQPRLSTLLAALEGCAGACRGRHQTQPNPGWLYGSCSAPAPTAPPACAVAAGAGAHGGRLHTLQNTLRAAWQLRRTRSSSRCACLHPAGCSWPVLKYTAAEAHLNQSARLSAYCRRCICTGAAPAGPGAGLTRT